jgi:hypothetical protein
MQFCSARVLAREGFEFDRNRLMRWLLFVLLMRPGITLPGTDRSANYIGSAMLVDYLERLPACECFSETLRNDEAFSYSLISSDPNSFSELKIYLFIYCAAVFKKLFDKYIAQNVWNEELFFVQSVAKKWKLNSVRLSNKNNDRFSVEFLIFSGHMHSFIGNLSQSGLIIDEVR